MTWWSCPLQSRNLTSSSTEFQWQGWRCTGDSGWLASKFLPFQPLSLPQLRVFSWFLRPPHSCWPWCSWRTGLLQRWRWGIAYCLNSYWQWAHSTWSLHCTSPARRRHALHSTSTHRDLRSTTRSAEIASPRLHSFPYPNRFLLETSAQGYIFISIRQILLVTF